MKLSLLQENLNTALNHVSRFISLKNQIPILNNILLKTDNNRLKLSATNLELSINYWIGAKIEQEGSVSVPSKEITEFVSYLDTGKIDLTVKNKTLLNLSSTKVESTFSTNSDLDYPKFPAFKLEDCFELDSNIFIQSINQIAFSAATDDTRPALSSILCQFTKNNLTLVATDGFRLSLKKIKFLTPIDLKSDQNTFLIPAKSLLEVTKLVQNDSKIKMGLTTDQHQIVFILEDIELFSRLIEKGFPDYQQIIPESFSTKVLLNKDDFIQSVKIASVFARESGNITRLNIKSNSIELTANAPQIGQNKTTLESKTTGNTLEIAFNYKFLMDFLNICKSKEISIEFNDSLSPAFFHDPSNPDLSHIIMPVRLQD